MQVTNIKRKQGIKHFIGFLRFKGAPLEARLDFRQPPKYADAQTPWQVNSVYCL